MHNISKFVLGMMEPLRPKPVIDDVTTTIFLSSYSINVLRAWIDCAAIAEALGLTHDQQVLLSQTVDLQRIKM